MYGGGIQAICSNVVTADPPVCQHRLASNFFVVQGAYRCSLTSTFTLTHEPTQAIQGQLERDQRLVDLVTTMENVYSFVDVVQSIPGKLQLLEDIITKILQQTVECAIFIREYTGHGFIGKD